MKKPIPAIPILMLVVFTCCTSPKTIVNPYYEFRNTGIYSIRQIKLTNSATYLTIHSDFIPGWWVMFTDDISIRDINTGNKYKVVDIKGAEFNKHLWMPKSGDSSVVLVFPPIPASVAQIDYHGYIFGVSLDENKAGTRAKVSILPEIEKWITDELAKSTTEPLRSFQSDDFFNETPARLIGCIKGYDPRSGFSTGIIYAKNSLTREDFPIVLQIQDDGRFDVEIPMVMPQNNMIHINSQWDFQFYLEPGQTLAMIIDGEEMLIADRKRNIRYKFNNNEYRGKLASLNYELRNAPVQESNHEGFMEKVNSMAPLDFKKENELALAAELKAIEKYFEESNVSEKAQTIIRNSVIVKNATKLFDFEMYREYNSREGMTNEILKIPVPNSYYDFLLQMNLNDRSLLVTGDFMLFINRFEYCRVFNSANSIAIQRADKPIIPQKLLLEYMLEKGVDLSEAEVGFLKLVDNMDKTQEDIDMLKNMEAFIKQFNEKYFESIQEWGQKYIIPQRERAFMAYENEIWKAKDSIMQSDLGLAPNLVYEIAKIRSLATSFPNYGSKEAAHRFWDFLRQGITTPYLAQSGERLLMKVYPEVKLKSTPLPEGIATDIFMKIIEPHLGKILFVNFWATTCGPCVSGIRNSTHLREKYAGNPDFDFVFITDVRSSPENHYNNFVKEQALTNNYRISNDDFNYLRQLFKFDGIPRYVVIDQNGHVINDNFNMYNLESELANLLPQYQQN